MSDSPGLSDLLNVKMSYDGERQKILAQNISSIDTPNYKAQDLVPLDFKDVLSSQNRQVSMTVTSSLHMNGMHSYDPRFRNTSLKNTFERTPVGSTVVVEEQMMKVAENATDYQMTTSLYSKVGALFKEALGLSSGTT